MRFSLCGKTIMAPSTVAAVPTWFTRMGYVLTKLRFAIRTQMERTQGCRAPHGELQSTRRACHLCSCACSNAFARVWALLERRRARRLLSTTSRNVLHRGGRSHRCGNSCGKRICCCCNGGERWWHNGRHRWQNCADCRWCRKERCDDRCH